MLVKLSLLPAVAVALTAAYYVDASLLRKDATHITLPVVKRVNATGTTKLLEVDQARARALRARGESKHHPDSFVNVPITNTLVTYIATVCDTVSNLSGLGIDVVPGRCW